MEWAKLVSKDNSKFLFHRKSDHWTSEFKFYVPIKPK